MKNKKILFGLLFLIIILASVLSFSRSELFKGFLGDSMPKQNPFSSKNIPPLALPSQKPSQRFVELPQVKTTVSDLKKTQALKSIEGIQAMLKRTQDLKTFIPKNVFESELSSNLSNIESKITGYQQKLTSAHDLEKDRLLHLFGHEGFDTQIQDIHKMAKLPQTLTELENLVTEIEKETKNVVEILRGYGVETPLRNTIYYIKKNNDLLRQWYDQGNVIELLEAIDELRKLVLPPLSEVRGTIEFVNKNRDQYSALPEYAKRLDPLDALLFKLQWYFEVLLPLLPEISSSAKVLEENKLKQKNINLYVCWVKWKEVGPDISPHPYDLNALRETLDQVVDLYKTNSYNQVNLSYTITPLLSWKKDLSSGLFSDDFFAYESAAIELCDPGVDFRSIDVFAVFPVFLKDVAGKGTQGNRFHHTKDGKVKMGTIEIVPGMSSHVWVHEIGHAFYNLPHANGIDCGRNSFKTTNGSPWKECKKLEYGNVFDDMGLGILWGHFNGFIKNRLGWISNILKITKDGEYQIASLDVSASDPQMLFIPLKDFPLCIDFRKESNTAGCLMSYVCGIPGSTYYPLQLQTYLIDVEPDSLDPMNYPNIPDVNKSSADFQDACLTSNQTFHNNELGIFSLFFSHTLNNRAKVTLDIDENKVVPLEKIEQFYKEFQQGLWGSN